MNAAPSKPRPVAPVAQFDNLPDELKDSVRWVLWRYIFKDDDWTKPPFQPNGNPAKSNDPTTWTDYRSACRAYRSGKFDGVGIFFADGSG